MRPRIAAAKQHAAKDKIRQAPATSHQASRAKQRARSLVVVFGLGMDMRKTGAPAQSQPASVDSDGTCLLLKGGQHDGLGCRMPRLPKATQGYPTLPNVTQGCPVGEKGRGG